MPKKTLLETCRHNFRIQVLAHMGTAKTYSWNQDINTIQKTKNATQWLKNENFQSKGSPTCPFFIIIIKKTMTRLVVVIIYS